MIIFIIGAVLHVFTIILCIFEKDEPFFEKEEENKKEENVNDNIDKGEDRKIDDGDTKKELGLKKI